MTTRDQTRRLDKLGEQIGRQHWMDQRQRMTERYATHAGEDPVRLWRDLRPEAVASFDRWWAAGCPDPADFLQREAAFLGDQYGLDPADIIGEAERLADDLRLDDDGAQP